MFGQAFGRPRRLCDFAARVSSSRPSPRERDPPLFPRHAYFARPQPKAAATTKGGCPPNGAARRVQRLSGESSPNYPKCNLKRKKGRRSFGKKVTRGSRRIRPMSGFLTSIARGISPRRIAPRFDDCRGCVGSWRGGFHGKGRFFFDESAPRGCDDGAIFRRHRAASFREGRHFRKPAPKMPPEMLWTEVSEVLGWGFFFFSPGWIGFSAGGGAVFDHRSLEDENGSV